MPLPVSSNRKHMPLPIGSLSADASCARNVHDRKEKAMYGRWWAYYLQARMRNVSQSHPSSGARHRSEAAFDHADDLWIFLRLALVLAVFLAGLAGILWVAG
jgi:hypothetical protein